MFTQPPRLEFSFYFFFNTLPKHKKTHSSESMAGDDDDHHDSGYNVDQRNMLLVLSLVGSAIAISSFLINVLLGAFASMLIQISLVVPPLSCFVTAVASLLTLNVPVAFFSLIMSAMGAYYAFEVWNKIPFATANLKIALSAIGDNHGLWALAYAVSMQACVWMLLWCSAVAELVKYSSSWVFDCTSSVDDEISEPVCRVSTPGAFIALGMIFSFFWTNQVLNNIFHTTIAGVVGTWWFNPEEETQSARRRSGWCGCRPAIYDSWIRSNFYSFGSICFGSSLVGVLKVLQFIVHFGRKRRQEQRRLDDTGPNATDFLCCLLQFLVDKLELIMEYFNSWAFVYVGLYGYDYWSAGKQVKTLFMERGWDVIVNDELVTRSLSMMSWLISLVTGLVGVFLGYAFLGLGFGIFPLFFFSVFLGRASCQVLFGVVTSAVDTVVVCFAESPNQLRNKHDPELFRDLIHAWRKAYPEDCGF
uniref:Choline transporter-like protein n=1 Tax=Pseudo-nitzschia australis TaxID=44445 RepID=A0A7S4EFK3_9STRA